MEVIISGQRDLSRAKYESPIIKGPAQDCEWCSRQCDPSIFNYIYYQMCASCVSSYTAEAEKELNAILHTNWALR